MKSGTITEHDLQRIITAVEHKMDVQPLEEPQVLVHDLDSDTEEGHIVDLDKMICTCSDFEYNCSNEQYCKHVFRTIFEKHHML